MKHFFTLVGVIAILSHSSVLAQIQGDKPPMSGLADGRRWLKLHDDAKLQFIQGVQYGLKLYEKHDPANASAEPAHDSIAFTNRDILMQIDSVYADSANIRIPIAMVYDYSEKKLSGGTPKELERILSSMREVWKPGS